MRIDLSAPRKRAASISLPPSPPEAVRKTGAKTMRNFATTLLASIASLAVSATMFNAILV
ncbi:hypothetical protein [Alteraurantiacibacter palmitatis]|uniref:Uncharacterized protein n=1 Tax=Alteraurantiacibacter palmitatis TaxID=2054628 RepID=A0ABV7E6B9_9SPHN